MNRRGFLKALGIGSAAAATGAIALLDEELWTPSRTFFLPPVGGWRGNQLLTAQQIANEALRILANEMEFDKVVNRSYSDAFATGRGGYVINVGRPPRYVAPLDLLNQQISQWQA